MKKTNTIYWIFTGLFGALMLFTAVPDILKSAEAVTFMTEHLGYPLYFVAFIGWAKVLGVLALFIPGYPRIKEWAYAGLAFDLVGAIFSILSVESFSASMLFILVPVVLGTVSYIYYHKRLIAA
ncbi:MAG: DoxX family protein [Bacteroidetes bacterium]|nr:DoxX family protein [Bacteroidota bacterium]